MANRFFVNALAATILVVGVCSAPIAEGAILVRSAQYNPAYFGYNGSYWATATNLLNASGPVTEVASFSNASQVNSADALWVDLGPIGSYPGLLSGAEIANI